MVLSRDVESAELFVIGKYTTIIEVAKAVNNFIIVPFERWKGKTIFDWKWNYMLLIYLNNLCFLPTFSLFLALLHSGTTVRASQAATQELLNVTSIGEIRMHVNNVDMLNIQTHRWYTGQY